MRNLHAVLAGGVLCAGACIALGLGIPGARAQEDILPASQMAASWSEVAQMLSDSRARQAIPPFDFERRTEADADVGRITYVLEGTVPPSAGRIFLPQAGETVDVHTVMIRADGTEGYFGIYHDFDPDNVAAWIFNIKALVFHTSSPDSRVVHFNPPVRFREGDVILANVQGPDAASTMLIVHGSIVPASEGDTLRVE